MAGLGPNEVSSLMRLKQSSDRHIDGLLSQASSRAQNQREKMNALKREAARTKDNRSWQLYMHKLGREEKLYDKEVDRSRQLFDLSVSRAQELDDIYRERGWAIDDKVTDQGNKIKLEVIKEQLFRGRPGTQEEVELKKGQLREINKRIEKMDKLTPEELLKYDERAKTEMDNIIYPMDKDQKIIPFEERMFNAQQANNRANNNIYYEILPEQSVSVNKSLLIPGVTKIPGVITPHQLPRIQKTGYQVTSQDITDTLRKINPDTGKNYTLEEALKILEGYNAGI